MTLKQYIKTLYDEFEWYDIDEKKKTVKINAQINYYCLDMDSEILKYSLKDFVMDDVNKDFVFMVNKKDSRKNVLLYNDKLVKYRETKKVNVKNFDDFLKKIKNEGYQECQ